MPQQLHKIEHNYNNLEENDASSRQTKSRAGWANMILVPIKQHAFCCGILPPLVTAAFGANAGDMLHSVPGEIILGLTVPPLVTYGTMALEQAWHNRRDTKCEHKSHHKTLTWKNYARQTALSYLFYAATSLITHAIWPHDHHHDHEDNHKHEHGHEHVMNLPQNRARKIELGLI